MDEDAMNGNESLRLLSDLADVLENGEVITRTNPALDGEVRVKRGGMHEGLVHLIDHRMRERVLSRNTRMTAEEAQKETSAVLFLAVDNIDKSPAIREENGHYAVYNRGIKTVIGKDRKGRYVVTGYDNNQTKQEATESINAVIAQYGNTPEFLGIYAQVGAVIASYRIVPQTQKNASKNHVPEESFVESSGHVTDSRTKKDLLASHRQNPDSELLHGNAVVEVDGIGYECSHGVMGGFKDAVLRNGELERRNRQLEKENAELKRQLESKQKHGKNRADGWER